MKEDVSTESPAGSSEKEDLGDKRADSNAPEESNDKDSAAHKIASNDNESSKNTAGQSTTTETSNSEKRRATEASRPDAEGQTANLDTKQANANADQSTPELDAYRKLRQNLKQLVSKKIKLDRELEKIEDKLAEKEDAYLNDANAGNIAKGFDQYTKSSQNRRKSVIVDQDRIFSQSNTSFDAEV